MIRKVKRTDIDTGVILSNTYVILGITEKEICRIKSYIDNRLVMQKLTNIEQFRDILFKQVLNVQVACFYETRNLEKVLFSLPCTNSQLNTMSFVQTEFTGTITGKVNKDDLDLWCMKNTMLGNIDIGKPYSLPDAFRLLWNYYLSVLDPYDDFRRYLRKARKRGLGLYPITFIYQDRHLYYGKYKYRSDYVLLEYIAPESMYIIEFCKHNKIEFYKMADTNDLTDVRDLGYDMSNIILQKGLA